MTTLAPLPTPMRQPFASLDGTRLRNLTNVKNSQNALPTTFSSAVKRRYSPSTLDQIDSENIDPDVVSAPTKKAKTFDETISMPIKPSAFILKNVSSAPLSLVGPKTNPIRLDTPRTSTLGVKRKANQSSSAPTAAGRSPKSKRIGILSRRRASASPFTRVDPPSFSTGGTVGGLPFSIDAALSGSVSSYDPKPAKHAKIRTLEESMPMAWMFNIHEDTMEQYLGNLIQHSTCTLDISDDESRIAAKHDRGKENVPPSNDLSASTIPANAVAGPVLRADMMTDGSRSPLGELDAKDFYADGCDASSYIIIPTDKCAEKANDLPNTISEVKKVESIVQPRENGIIEPKDGWKDFLAKVKESQESIAAAASASTVLETPAAEIEIWESESAKGDDDDEIAQVSSLNSAMPVADLADGEIL